MRLLTFGPTAVQTSNNDSSKHAILCVDSDRAHGEVQDIGMVHAHRSSLPLTSLVLWMSLLNNM